MATSTHEHQSLIPSAGQVRMLRVLAEQYHRAARSGGVIGEALPSAEAYFTLFLLGVELGVSPATAVQEISRTKKGKTSISARLKVAMIRRRGVGRIDLVECTPTKAVVAVRRPEWPEGREERVAFTMEDAQRAGLAGRENYQSHPAAMLAHRAFTHACNVYFQEGNLGLPYTHDELGVEVADDGLDAEDFGPTQAPPSASSGIQRKSAAAAEAEAPAVVVAPEEDEDAAGDPATRPLDEPPTSTPAADAADGPTPEQEAEIKRLFRGMGYERSAWQKRLERCGAARLSELSNAQAAETLELLRVLMSIRDMRSMAEMSVPAWRSVLAKRGVEHELLLELDDARAINAKLRERYCPFDGPLAGNALPPAAAPASAA